MTPIHAPTDATRGILLMIGAIFCFTLMDATAKELSGRVGVMTTLWARYAGQAVLVFLLVLPRLSVALRTRYPGMQLARSVVLLMATLCFFTGLSRIGMAEATAIMDVNPVLITLGAALFLGEKIGLRRALGIAAALIGALIVIRPGTDVFSPFAIFPLMAAVFYSAYALITRFVGRDEDAWTSLLYTAAFGAIVLTAGLPVFGQMPTDWVGLALMVVIGGIGTVGQLLLIRALQAGEAGLLAPFAYAALIFAPIWGIVFFDEWPDGPTLIGAAIIALSGIYVWYRETRQN
ncbi:DMT family transporter [Primorskyibacter aestuariivivens]|uniref:DMT family transporter n=1 Tax=Primorskyibacter aestuariivivens TaxID=1888912 RepID=UPI0022FFC585|nr:DMT family transporter [Primorskyibacter aestuariivivens]MDA7427031.1 DMT family transporter [Primorskyibacter aestuariivivens]